MSHKIYYNQENTIILSLTGTDNNPYTGSLSNISITAITYDNEENEAEWTITSIPTATQLQFTSDECTFVTKYPYGLIKITATEILDEIIDIEFLTYVEINRGLFLDILESPDFYIQVSNPKQIIQLDSSGASLTYIATPRAYPGFNNNVTISTNNLPIGASASYQPDPPTVSCDSTVAVTITVDDNVIPGTYNMKIIGEVA